MMNFLRTASTSPSSTLGRTREAAVACHNRGAWQVRIGEAGQSANLPASPIIL